MKRNLILDCIVCIIMTLTARVAVAQDHINPLTSQCWFTALTDTATYNLPDLSERHSTRTMPAGRSLQVLEVNEEVALVAIDHAMGFWVKVEAGVFSGLCSDVDGYPLPDAVALENARLWSYPDVISGEVVGTLPTGAAIEVTGGAVEGRIRIDAADVGLWYPLQYAGLSGWVWSERLDFDAAPDVPIINAVALENARLWSRPDVKQAGLLALIPKDAELAIIGGRITGHIQLDTNAIGIWYQVRYGTITGWMWEDRLQF